MPATTPKTLIYLGHPGHELRLYDWISIHQPEVWVITDGSGHLGEPRTELSRKILLDTGTPIASFFGRYKDSEIYTAILRVDIDFFVSLARQLTEGLIKGNFERLVSDSAEGYNPSHDLCFLIASAAAQRFQRQMRRPLPHYAFPLEGDPRGAPESNTKDTLSHYLTPEAAANKIKIATDYARTIGGMLLKEVEQAQAHYGNEIFRHERLFPVLHHDYLSRFESTPPFFELHGEKRAQAGTYDEVIRFSEHIKPIALALDAFARGKDSSRE